MKASVSKLVSQLKINAVFGLSLLVGMGFAAFASDDAAHAQKKTWSIRAEYIEACSCNLFCECYFNTHPDGEMFCEFNNAIRIIQGHVGDVKVDGLYCWVSGDLGGDFSKGVMKGAVLTFEPKTTKEQREAIMFLMGQIYPVKWEKFITDEAPITWNREGMNGHAKLGDKAEIWLTGVKDSAGNHTVVQNLNYWGAKKNTGFYLAMAKHYYKGNGYDYNHENKNGFFITIESSGEVSK